jgi:TatD DNase family protein
MLIDTHCHLNADVFKNRWCDVIREANAVGVEQFFVVGWDQTSSLAAITLATQSPQIKAVIGIHPVDVKGNDSFDWITSTYHQHASSIVAIGEIGLDFYWKKTEAEHQQQTHALIQQIAIAN